MSAWRTWMAISSAVVALLAGGCETGSPAGPAASSSASTRAPLVSATPGTPSSSAGPGAARTSAPPAAKALWLESLQMSTPSTGWALYLAGNPFNAPLRTPTLLVRTTDGARTWTDATPSAALALLSTPNARQVLDAGGADSAYFAVTVSPDVPAPATTRVFATGDGGRTWTESAPVGADGFASRLSFADSRHGWLLISEGAAMGKSPVQVYRTADGGAHWSLTAQSPPLNSDSDSGIPVECDKTAITFASATAGWLSSACNVGLSGELLVSRDGGVTWGPQPLPLPAGMCGGDAECELYGPEFTDGTGFVTVGAYGGATALLASRDLGKTWLPVPLPVGYASGKYPYPQVKFFDPEHGVVVSAGSQGTIGAVFYTTSDGGQTWTAVPQGGHFTRFGTAIDFVNPLVGFAWTLGGDAQGASPPPVYETTNSGRTWTAFNSLVSR